MTATTHTSIGFCDYYDNQPFLYTLQKRSRDGKWEKYHFTKSSRRRAQKGFSDKRTEERLYYLINNDCLEREERLRIPLLGAAEVLVVLFLHHFVFKVDIFSLPCVSRLLFLIVYKTSGNRRDSTRFHRNSDGPKKLIMPRATTKRSHGITKARKLLTNAIRKPQTVTS